MVEHGSSWLVLAQLGFTAGYFLTILAIAWRPRWVLLGFAVTLGSSLFLDEQVTALLFIGINLALAAYTARALPLIIMLIAALGWELGWRILHDAVDERLLWPIPILLLLILPGQAIRHISARGKRERARAKEREATARRRETALVEEHKRQRLAMSRELHDVVAHELTRIAMHASVAQLTDDPNAEHEALQAISASAREGMSEMRRLVRFLDPNDTTPVKPGEGIGALDLVRELDGSIEYLTGLGFQADQRLSGDPAQLPAGLLPTTVMVLREATTNIAKHTMPGAHCQLVIDITDQAVIEIRNESSASTSSTAPGSGLGLPGLRGRINDLGGTISTGQQEGWWSIRAVLPLNRQTRSDHGGNR